MGTRNLTCVVAEGEMRVAQYGQWDGYPTGQGEKIKEFFSRPDLDLGKFRDAVLACSFATEAELKRIEPIWLKQMDELQKVKYGDTPYEDSRKLQEESYLKADSYTYLSRDVGAQILGVIYARGGLLLRDERTFAADSLFCEFAYVVDLDAMTLEVYLGFNKTGPVPSSNRFAYLNAADTWHEKDKPKEYWPVSLFKVIPLHDLPDTSMEALEAEMYPEDELEDA